jgi:hypothetical protein
LITKAWGWRRRPSSSHHFCSELPGSWAKLLAKQTVKLDDLLGILR